MRPIVDALSNLFDRANESAHPLNSSKFFLIIAGNKYEVRRSRFESKTDSSPFLIHLQVWFNAHHLAVAHHDNSGAGLARDFV